MKNSTNEAAFVHERAIQSLMTGGIAEKSVQSIAKNDRLIKNQRVIQYHKRLRQCLTIKPFVKVDKVLDWNIGRFLVVLAFFIISFFFKKSYEKPNNI